ncbi:MAG: DNA-processing protein DprA [Gammaproteobacteria bacterium]|nr:DNA-processing protein DprA [Gammaproteobacteria bacterium]MDH4254169.1 DNA-processing protein DprA [Gammaproteobacteria bacterium]MDH5309963.1 DNA-processing protein DprA [Gammaproteobacteria bacterium]
MTDDDRQLRDWLGRGRHFLITAESDDYPELLRELGDNPAALYVDGDRDVLQLPAIAIVGSRNPTRGGTSNAYEFARHLARSGFVIVSGLAQGIDTAAHQGALDVGGRTIAVLGHGMDSVYPASNRELAGRIAASGALVTEFPLGTPPRRENFPARNRIISGLSLGTLVVEAARRSGSLITARLAGEQGREVFALPGSIHNPLAKGCHQLIRQGAKLVESVDDILSELRPLATHLMQNQADDAASSERPARDQQYQLLLDALAYDPASAEELASRSGLTIGQVSSMLLILELEGEVESLPGGRFSLVSTK